MWEDVGIYRINGPSTLLQSIDVISAISDNAYTLGEIAAAHALSDVYAKGGQPITGMITLAYPPSHVSHEKAAAIIQGVMDKLLEAGATPLGGHTVISSDLLVGVAVSAVTDVAVPPNGPVKPGDVLVLTKPLGTGIVATALRMVLGGEELKGFSKEVQLEAEMSMVKLNDTACRSVRRGLVNACTDVTGFGLVGHLMEMLDGNCARLFVNQVPLLRGATALLAEGVTSAGGDRNLATWWDNCTISTQCARDLAPLFFDPQTSGGLLMSTSRNLLDDLMNSLSKDGVSGFVIGEITQQRHARDIELC
jgi:selenide,water dikinase